MSPLFHGRGTVKVEVGKYAGDNIEVFRAEENSGLALVRSLNPHPAQRSCIVSFRLSEGSACGSLAWGRTPTFAAVSQ